MIVITLTDCPPRLRGDLTKWFQEINTGVYVGQVSARVRDLVWKRVQDNIKSGRATMVYSTNNEQRMDFRVHNTSWEPIDFDGLKLMLRPSPARIKKLADLRMGYSKAAQMHKARQMSKRKPKNKSLPKNYVIVDLVTTGPSTIDDELLNIYALRVCEGEVQKCFTNTVVPEKERKEPTSCDKKFAQVLSEFLAFVSDLPVVTHNEEYIYGFLRTACKRCELPLFSNPCIDIITLSRRLLDDVKNYRLETLLEYFKIETSNQQGCLVTKALYDKLIEFQQVKE